MRVHAGIACPAEHFGQHDDRLLAWRADCVDGQVIDLEFSALRERGGSHARTVWDWHSCCRDSQQQARMLPAVGHRSADADDKGPQPIDRPTLMDSVSPVRVGPLAVLACVPIAPELMV